MADGVDAALDAQAVGVHHRVVDVRIVPVAAGLFFIVFLAGVVGAL